MTNLVLLLSSQLVVKSSLEVSTVNGSTERVNNKLTVILNLSSSFKKYIVVNQLLSVVKNIMHRS